MSTAWVFAGHGAQYVGMGRPILRSTEAGRTWLAAAEEISGQKLGAFASQGPVRALMDPRVLEPLLAAISGAYVELLTQEEGLPDCVAGYSAGHVPALYAAGVVDRATCLQIACIRGEELARAADLVAGGMVSVHGLPEERLAELAEADPLHPASIAARNGPLHMVYSGTISALARAAASATAAGAITAPLDVAGPWHSPLLEPACAAIESAVAGLPFCTPQRPVWSTVTGLATEEPEHLRRLVAVSITSAVEWHATVLAMLDAGVDSFVEVSPGRTLFALLGQVTSPNFQRRYVECSRGRARTRKQARQGASLGQNSFEQEPT